MTCLRCANLFLASAATSATAQNLAGDIAMGEMSQNVVDSKLGIDRHYFSVPHYKQRVRYHDRIVAAFPLGGAAVPNHANARVYKINGHVKEVCAGDSRQVLCRTFN